MEKNNFLLEESRARHNAFNEQTLPMIRPVIDEITQRLKLEYYGIDCNIDEQGNTLIFEINANMNILHNTYQPLEDQMQRIRQHILKLLDRYATRGNRQKITQIG